MWIVDFGIDMSESEASLYEYPYEYVRKHVKPERDKVRNLNERRNWWLHARPAPDLRRILQGTTRYIATSNVAKYRTFVWIKSDVLPSHSLTVITKGDDYLFGVLHSKVHELWSLRLGTSLEDRPRYTPTTCFETFPFPWSPGSEPADNPIVQAIAQAAKELVEKRDNWLNPAGATQDQLKKLTLTNLYNARPTWLDLAHKKLDAAVLAAYGWSDLMTNDGITDEETLLSRLLALNLERAAKQGEVQLVLPDENEDFD